MRLLKFLALTFFAFAAAGSLYSQSFTFNCTKDTVIGRCQGSLCFTLKATIPDIHALSGTYTVNPIGPTPSSCFPVYLQPNDPTGDTTSLTVDDIYSDVINIGFPFPFYGTVYNSLIASSNGVISFDVSKTGQFAHYGILRDINILSATAGVPENLPSNLYDAALIMGPYHDLNPEYPTSPTRIVQRKTIGVSPHRKWILSYYKLPLYFVTGGCNLLIENTHQVVLYESTGIIEVLIYSSQPCLGWNDGRAMIGIQNAGKNQALMVNGRKASDPPWGSPGMNEAYRFVPSAGSSLFKRVELYDILGNLVTIGTTTNLGNGKLEASFPNICPPIGATTSYIIKSVYAKFDNPAVEVYGTDTINITKSASTNLNATAVTTNSGCFASTGTITVTVPPGTATPPYSYILDGGSPVSGPSPYTFNNVSAGPHTILAGDPSFTCSSSINVIVGKNNDLTASITTTATACAGVGTGSITITPTNGSGPYMFKLDGFLPVPGNVPFTFNNVFGGNHLVIVTDASGCQTNVLTVNVPVGPGVNGNTTSTSSSCASVANGTITVTATSGIPPFTWQLDGGTVQNGTSPFTFSNVAAGAHIITITDSAGCNNNINANVAAGPGVLGNATSTPASCQGVNNGTITATATLGTAPFSWQLDGGPFQTGTSPYTFTNISGGTHFVTIKDNVGCTRTINVNVASGTGPIASAVSTATSCNGSVDGKITASAVSGAPPYSYSLDGAIPVPGGLSHTFINVNPGIHTVVVTDLPGCISNTVSVNVAAGPPLTTTVIKTNVLCNGDATGAIFVNQPALGTPPFEYSIDGINWQTSNQFSGLVANAYTVAYRSANGCTGSQTVSITEPARLDAATAVTPVKCFGENNGVINVIPSGGVTPYRFSIDGGITWQANPVFNVPAGNYTITIRDFNDCIITKNISVTEPLLLTAFSVNSNASCDGGNDGQINVTAIGGNAGYAYSIDGINFQPSSRFYVAPGNYNITVKDNLGCSTSFTTAVGLTVNLFLVPPADVTICEGSSGQLQLNTNANIFSWTPATGLNNPNVSNPVANPVVTTQYTINLVLGRCSTSDSMKVIVNPAPIPDAGPDGDICYGQSDTLQGSGGTQFLWSPPVYLNTTSGANPVATPTITTIYTLSVIDAVGCPSLVTDNVKVVVSRPLRVYTYPFDTTVYPGDRFRLQVASAGIRYSWSPAGGLSNTNIANPVVTAGAIGDDITYQVVATTAEGCKGEGYVRIRLSKGPDIYVPTGFTPNGDGTNDKFTPVPVGIKDYNYFRVFNRWGQVIFSTTRQHEGWDGKRGGKDQPGGIYVWMIEGVTKDNRVISKKGTVLLVR